MFAIIGLVLVVVVGVMLLAGHGPGQHTPSGAADRQTPPFLVTASGAVIEPAAPAGGHAPR